MEVRSGGAMAAVSDFPTFRQLMFASWPWPARSPPEAGYDDSPVPGGRFRRRPLQRQSGGGVPAAGRDRRVLDAGGGGGDEPGGDRLPTSARRRLGAALVHTHHRGGPVRLRDARGGARVVENSE